MARLEKMHPAMRASLLAMECPVFDSHPWAAGPPLYQRRVALISTAGLHRRDDRPFAVTSGNSRAIAGDYRVIPGDIAANDLVMSHVSTNFDSTVFADWFWRETTAGRVLFAVHDACQRSDVPGIQVVANNFLIPRARTAESPYAAA